MWMQQDRLKTGQLHPIRSSPPLPLLYREGGLEGEVNA